MTGFPRERVDQRLEDTGRPQCGTVQQETEQVTTPGAPGRALLQPAAIEQRHLRPHLGLHGPGGFSLEASGQPAWGGPIQP